jgi:hypothetical protein
LFDKTDVSLTGDISALLADAALAVGANPDKYGLYEIYVPTVDLGAETPQTFIGPPEVPEPSPLLLLGSAMLGLSLLLYFRKHNVHSLNLG